MKVLFCFIFGFILLKLIFLEYLNQIMVKLYLKLKYGYNLWGGGGK